MAEDIDTKGPECRGKVERGAIGEANPKVAAAAAAAAAARGEVAISVAAVESRETAEVGLSDLSGKDDGLLVSFW